MKKRAPYYSHIKTVGYLNAHVKTISHLNLLRVISKSRKTDIETTIVTHYLLLQYVIKKVIKLFVKHGVRSVWKDLE